MAKILVVDDEADLQILIQQRFRQKIKQKDYEFIFAMNGREALEKLNENPDIDLVLSDINMPEMDGLTLLSRIKETNSLLKSIIVSAYGDMDNIRIAMNRGAFDFVTKPVDFKDLEITIDRTMEQVKQLKETIKAIKQNNILKMYVDETVLRFMENKANDNTYLENETVEATVAFIDIVEFTRISESQPPDVVVNLLNRYFDLMVKEIIDKKGIIDKFMGDCVMAVFMGERHLQRTVAACLEIKKKLKTQQETVTEEHYKPSISIGINSGEMVSGNIGSHTLRRLDYTVVGDVVNVASRLQAVASKDQIFTTAFCYDRLKTLFSFKEIGEVLIRNKKEPLMVYEVLE